MDGTSFNNNIVLRAYLYQDDIVVALSEFCMFCLFSVNTEHNHSLFYKHTNKSLLPLEYKIVIEVQRSLNDDEDLASIKEKNL